MIQIMVNKSRKYVEALYLEKTDAKPLYYHNWSHTDRMVKQAVEIAQNSGLSKNEIRRIEIAALFHDVGYLIDPVNHEESGAQIAMEFLDTLKCNGRSMQAVRKLIMATRMNSIPQSTEEKIMKDADMSHLGNEEYMIDYNTLLREINEYHGIKCSKEEWKMKTIDFIENQSYYTDYAQKKYETQKQLNLQKVKNLNIMLEENIEIDSPEIKKKSKKSKKKDIPEKGIETLFRVALRNHMNLSRIADNKANTLISVNGILISIVLSTLFPKLDSNPFLIYPGYALLGFAILTIGLSILSTIPKTTHGKLSREDISLKKGNLMFFGNFHSMSLDDFEWGISEVMNDKDYLYKNLTRDLYFLGKVLNRKYNLLRYSYISFILGLVVSIILFVFSVQQIGY